MGAAVGSGVQSPHSSWHRSLSENPEHSSALKRAQNSTSLLRQGADCPIASAARTGTIMMLFLHFQTDLEQNAVPGVPVPATPQTHKVCNWSDEHQQLHDSSSSAVDTFFTLTRLTTASRCVPLSLMRPGPAEASRGRKNSSAARARQD